jgi:hypothetical protein
MIALAAIAGSGACGRGRGSPGDAGSHASSPPVPAPADASLGGPPAAAGPSGSSHASMVAHLPCRAIAADGEVRAAESDADVAGTRVTNMSEIPDNAWLSLAPGARLVAKDPRTTRETTFLGPSLARACVERAEESWLVSGTFESVVGAGESPGAEEWVVTPHAVVRYAAARLHGDAEPKDTRIQLANGVAFLWPPQGTAASEGWERMTTPEATIAGPAGVDPAAAAAAVDRCSSLAEHSRVLARALLSPSDGGSGQGNVAGEQVTARRLARAACAVAALRAASLPAGESGRKQGLSGKLREAEAAWRFLPVAGSPP